MFLTEMFDPELDEAATSVLYHYTTLRPARQILQTGVFELTTSIGSREEAKHAPNGYPYFLSTTRSKVGDYHARMPGRHAVMFVLDGNYLNRHYKVKPVDYWERMWASDPHSQRTREAEDRVFSKEPTIPADCITEMHQLIADPEHDETRGYVIRELAILAKKRGIPVYFYTDTNAWLMQDKRKAVPLKQIQHLLTGRSLRPGMYFSRRISNLEAWIELIYKKNKNELSQEASQLRYNLVYYGARYPEEDQNLSVALANARKPGEPDRKYAVKLISYMRKNGMSSTRDLKQAMVDKWSENR